MSDIRAATCMHYGMDGPVFWPLMYLTRWGQRIRCPVCQRKLTRPTMRWAVRAWNRRVRPKKAAG